MTWRVLIVRSRVEGVGAIVQMLSRAGIAASYEQVSERSAVLAALGREEWELVIYEPAMRTDVPLELIYAHSPASAIVIVSEPDDMADELSRVVAARIDLS